MRAAILANPRRVGEEALRSFIERHRSRVRFPVVALLESPSDAGRWVDRAARLGCSAVVVAGGDGTLHHALPHLLRRRMPVFPFPAGTANDLAAAVGIHAGSLDGFRLDDAELRPTDVLVANGRPFLTSGVLGLPGDAAARLILGVLLVDHIDGTLARRFHVREQIPSVDGARLDLVTDIVGLTLAPMFFCVRAGVFADGWGIPVAVAALMTCSLKYAMKEEFLKRGFTAGAPPAFLTVMLFWLLRLPPAWATAYAIGLIALCLAPVRFPITSLVTTHWKPGWRSVTNYLTFAAAVPTLLWLREAPAWIYWVLAANVAAQLVVVPALMARGLVREGFHRAW